VDLKDEDTVPNYMKISEKVLHLRRLGMTYVDIADRLGVNVWMVKKAARCAETNRNNRMYVSVEIDC
jgi:transcriptional regulator